MSVKHRLISIKHGFVLSWGYKNFILFWKEMNSTIDKIFYTFSIESLFLRYKKIAKKPVKFGSFFQCSVYIFLGHDIMKNFQVKHGQCESIMFPKTFSFESSN